jgi:hypothetical protein
VCLCVCGCVWVCVCVCVCVWVWVWVWCGCGCGCVYLYSLRETLADNRPLSKVLGLDAETPMQCPPGRSYLLQELPNNVGAERKRIRLIS